MRDPLQAAVMLAALFATMGAPAAPSEKRGDEQQAQASDSRCRKEVKDYVDAIRFVRQSAGSQIGDRVAGNYVSEAELVRVAAARGSCSASQLLREKGANR